MSAMFLSRWIYWRRRKGQIGSGLMDGIQCEWDTLVFLDAEGYNGVGELCDKRSLYFNLTLRNVILV